jgi:hypothetical protein
MENASRGMGLLGDWEGVRNWYGGRVQQIGRLVKDPTTKEYDIHLEPLEMRSSSRFSRFMGSRRIFHLRVSDADLYDGGDKVRDFLRQKFLLCGRMFVPFHTKDTVYMVETDESYERVRDSTCGDQYRKSFEEFINWHNPIHRNRKQVYPYSSSLYHIIKPYYRSLSANGQPVGH